MASPRIEGYPLSCRLQRPCILHLTTKPGLPEGTWVGAKHAGIVLRTLDPVGQISSLALSCLSRSDGILGLDVNR